MAFGEQLQALRRRSGLTQEQFAEELEVSRQAVSKWESGRGYPEMEKLLYICHRYGVTLNELFEMGATVPQNQSATIRKKGLLESVNSLITNLSPKNRALFAGGVGAALLIALIVGLLAKGSSNDMMSIIWIAAIVIFGIVEAATAGLTSIWFVAGSVAGLVVAALNGSLWLQIGLFLVVSITALILTRPLVRKLTSNSGVATNADRVLGGTARVNEAIDNSVPCGAVYIDGKTWSARSVTGEKIPMDTMVTVERMEGVKLFVR